MPPRRFYRYDQYIGSPTRPHAFFRCPFLRGVHATACGVVCFPMLKRHCMRSRSYMCIHCAVHCFAHHDIWHGWPSTTATEGCLPCFCLHTCMCSNSIASFGCCSMYIEQQALLFVAQLYAHIGTRLWALLFYAICCVHRLLAHACKSWAYLKTKVGTHNTIFWIWYIYIYIFLQFFSDCKFLHENQGAKEHLQFVVLECANMLYLLHGDYTQQAASCSHMFFTSIFHHPVETRLKLHDSNDIGTLQV